MGVLDKLQTSNGGGKEPPRREEPYQAEQYGYEDFSDDVRVWIVDTWPSYKPLRRYDLMFIEDPVLKDPVVINCPQNITIPDGTKILRYDESVATTVEDTRFHVVRGLLVHPHVIEFAKIEELFDNPEPMEGREIETVEGTDLELVHILISVWEAGNESDDSG